MYESRTLFCYICLERYNTGMHTVASLYSLAPVCSFATSKLREEEEDTGFHELTVEQKYLPISTPTVPKSSPLAIVASLPLQIKIEPVTGTKN